MEAPVKPFGSLVLTCLLTTVALAENAAPAGGHRGGNAGRGTAVARSGRRGLESGRFGNGYSPYGGLFYPGLFDYWGSTEPSFVPDYGNASAAVPPARAVFFAPPPPPEVAHPVIHEYGAPAVNTEAPLSNESPIVYLIAFKDSTVKAATTYWVDHGKLYYLDSGHKEREAALSSVDGTLSERLNRERRVPFQLPQ